MSTKGSGVLLAEACDSAVRPCGCGPEGSSYSADGWARALPEGKEVLCHRRGHFPRGSESHQDWPAV